MPAGVEAPAGEVRRVVAEREGRMLWDRLSVQKRDLSGAGVGDRIEEPPSPSPRLVPAAKMAGAKYGAARDGAWKARRR